VGYGAPIPQAGGWAVGDRRGQGMQRGFGCGGVCYSGSRRYAVVRFATRRASGGANPAEGEKRATVRAPEKPVGGLKLERKAGVRISRQSLGIAGVVVLALGVFAPVVRLPFVGSVNYFRNGDTDGTFVLIFAAVAAALILTKKYRLVLIPAALSLGIIGYDFIDLQARLHRARATLDSAGDLFRPLRGLGALALQAVQLQWGWVAMLIGVALLAGAALMKDETPAVSAALDGQGGVPTASGNGE
jgi:hypothetical protein